jgi:hypothetical protein
LATSRSNVWAAGFSPSAIARYGAQLRASSSTVIPRSIASTALWITSEAPAAGMLGEGDLDVRVSWVWTVRAGRVVAMQAFLEERAARAAIAAR